MEGMSVQAQAARRDYKRQYRIRNRDRINDQQRVWRKKNPDKVKEYQAQYWERRAEKGKSIRASWEDYGITRARYKELTDVIRSGEYAAVVRSAVYSTNKDIAAYILMSVEKKLSYDDLQRLWELGEIERMPCCRTDFYGYRRLFFHYLDCALRDADTTMQEETDE